MHISKSEAELFARCSLLVTFYSLLSARCSLIFSSLLITFCSLLFAPCSLLFACLIVAYCEMKLLWIAKKMVWLLRNSATDIFLANFWDFRNFFWMVVFKVFSTCKTIYSTKFTGKHLRWSLFYNKAAGWRPLTSLNTETSAGVFLWTFWNLYKNIYFASTCEGMPLINKIFTGASFRKMLGFYYKLKRQFFYYEGTSS